MAILGCNVDINFGQTLASGPSLSNTLRTKLHAWTESSIIVEFMVKLIWQHNLPIGSYGTFKMPPRMLDFWCSKGKKWDSPQNSKTKSQRSEPKWLLKYLITPICAKFQPNRLTTTFGPWDAYFSNSDTFKIIARIMFVNDHFAKENPNSSCLKQMLSFLLRGNSGAQGVSIGWIKSHQLNSIFM